MTLPSSKQNRGSEASTRWMSDPPPSWNIAIIVQTWPPAFRIAEKAESRSLEYCTESVPCHSYNLSHSDSYLSVPGEGNHRRLSLGLSVCQGPTVEQHKLIQHLVALQLSLLGIGRSLDLGCRHCIYEIKEWYEQLLITSWCRINSEIKLSSLLNLVYN